MKFQQLRWYFPKELRVRNWIVPKIDVVINVDFVASEMMENIYIVILVIHASLIIKKLIFVERTHFTLDVQYVWKICSIQ
jgi:hypothetical protein